MVWAVVWGARAAMVWAVVWRARTAPESLEMCRIPCVPLVWVVLCVLWVARAALESSEIQ